MSAVLEALHKVVGGENLTDAEAAAALEQVLEGTVDAAVIAGLLTALRIKGETVDEIVGFARAMRAHAAPIVCERVKPAEMVDTCGTGGDGADTFNISTVSAFVVAGAGVPVAKHGNRSISSRCGSADVLEAAGAVIQLTPQQAAAALDETGIGFLFAPLIHPAMRHVQPIRKELKMRTIFNLLGPLTNPAGAGAQVAGVFSANLVRPMAEALSRLGVGHAFVVHGQDGLDEISTTAPTTIAEVLDGSITEQTVTAEADFGLPAARPEDLAGGDHQECALILQRVLEGKSGPQRDIVLANAAAALVAVGKAKDFRTGVALSRESIDSGAANDRLKRFVKFTSQFLAE
jgi:anthranilate phosphoribosyltransferase